MRNAVIMPVLLALLLVVACGCYTRQEPYKSANLTLVREQAGLVVSGHVTAVNVLANHPGPEVKTEAFGVIGSECVTDTAVTMTVDSVEKGDAPAGPLTFQYQAPCFLPAKGFMLHYTARTLVSGDKAKVYLVKRGDTWWMIGHVLKSPAFTNEAAESVPNP